jgi:subtilase family serine protease
VRHHVGARRLAVIGTGVLAALALAGSPVMAASHQRVTVAATSTSAHQVRPLSVWTSAGRPNPKDATFGCQTDRGPTALVCYSPQQIRTAYGVDKLLAKGYDGTGRTIVIVDAFSNPLIEDDLAFFDELFGLPDPPNFQIIAPQGLTPFDSTSAEQVGWAGEIDLDVQWAHAIAPGANIKLVLAKTSDDADILAATKWAVDHNAGDVISQSFGEAESCVDPKIASKQHQLFQKATHRGITLFASSGDQGSAQPSCDGDSWIKSASSPAADPLVTAVGGTELFAAPDQRCFDNAGNIVLCPNPPAVTPGTYDHEVALDELDQDPIVGPLGGDFSTGGGFSNEFGRPFYQVGFDHTRAGHRGLPDISYDAGINHGVLGVIGVEGGCCFVFGGTSAGSPQWSAIVAIADQIAGHRLGTINPDLYGIARFGGMGTGKNALLHDVTDGQNGVLEYNSDGSTINIPGFNARRGWDATTGLGSPNAGKLVPLLVALSH